MIYMSDNQIESFRRCEFNRNFFQLREKKDYLCDQLCENKFDFIV